MPHPSPSVDRTVATLLLPAPFTLASSVCRSFYASCRTLALCRGVFGSDVVMGRPVYTMTFVDPKCFETYQTCQDQLHRYVNEIILRVLAGVVVVLRNVFGKTSKVVESTGRVSNIFVPSVVVDVTAVLGHVTIRAFP